MAIINYETQDNFINNRSTYVTWPSLANNDTGEPLQFAGHADKTMQVFGTFGGGSLTFQGSNDPRVVSDPSNAVWFTLNDTQTLPMVLTTASGGLIIENPRFIRPSVASGDGTTSLTVIICCKSVGV